MDWSCYPDRNNDPCQRHDVLDKEKDPEEEGLGARDVVVAEGQVDANGEDDGDDVGGEDDGAACDQVLCGSVVAVALEGDAIADHDGADYELNKAHPSNWDWPLFDPNRFISSDIFSQENADAEDEESKDCDGEKDLNTEGDKGHKEGNLVISKHPQSTNDVWITRCQGIELFQNKSGFSIDMGERGGDFTWAQKPGWPFSS